MARTALAVKSKELFPPIFSRQAEAYERRLDEVMARGEARGRTRVLELIAAQPGMRVLDLACGPGTLTAPIAAQVRPRGRVVGIDLAYGMVARARDRKIDGADFAVMDAESLAFGDATFDAAVCGHGMQFMPDVGAALWEARRVLNRGSVFAASIPASRPPSGLWARFDEIARRWLAPLPKPLDHDATKATVADPEALRAASRGAGFREAQVELVEEHVRWASADELVALTAGWWDCATRLEATEPERREAFLRDAVTTLRREYPEPIETAGFTFVLWARA